MHLIRLLRRILFILARSRFAGWFIRMGFAHMSFGIPIHRLRETPALLAFHHPSPSYPVHVLIVPRRVYRSLMDVPADDGSFMKDLVDTVQTLVRDLGLEVNGYRLIVNGGKNQDIPMLHFHLVSGDALTPGTKD